MNRVDRLLTAGLIVGVAVVGAAYLAWLCRKETVSVTVKIPNGVNGDCEWGIKDCRCAKGEPPKGGF